MKKALLLPALLLLFARTINAQSALDGFDPNANDRILAIVVQSDGKIILGGAFTTLAPNGGPVVTRNRIARLNPDGTLDSAFNPNANGTVYTVALQPDGKILIGGTFHGANSIGGQSRDYIARLEATTGLADSLNPDANGPVSAIAIQRDRKILVVGEFLNIGGQSRRRMARLDPASGLADLFNPDADNNVALITIQPNDDLLVSGAFTVIGGQTRHGIARLNATTGQADSFDPAGASPVTVASAVIQGDGKILVGGAFTTIGGQARNNFARLDPVTGSADSLNPSPNNTVYSLALQSDGKVLIGGNFTSIGGQTRSSIARFDPTTGLADSFDSKASGGGSTIVYAIAVQPDGKILAGGNFNAMAPSGGPTVTRNAIARLEIDGRLDRTLNLDAVGNFVAATAVQPDGKILIGGNFTNVLGVARNYIARLNADGTLDAAFNPNPNSYVYTITLQSDGMILVGGEFTQENGTPTIGGQTRNRIARLHPTTGLADSFDPNANFPPHSIAVQADGKILVGGRFWMIGGQIRNYLARLNPVTGVPDSWNPNATSTVNSVAIQPDGKIVVGGSFWSIGGQTRNYIARLDPVTGLADSFNPNPDDEIYSIALQPDGKVLAGGPFETIGGQTRNHIARLDPITGLADSWNPNANGYIESIALQADGKILIGGGFNDFNGGTTGGQPRNYIARLDPVTGLADSFDPNAEFTVLSIAVQADGKVLAGGNFMNIGGQKRNIFARLTNDTAAEQFLAVTQSTITWAREGSSPHLTGVTFESSNDNANYTPLGDGTAAGSNWILTGLNFPTEQSFYIRARGHYRSGRAGGSESITQSVTNVFLVPPTITSANNTTFTVGSAGTFIVTTAGSPTAASMLIAASGALPIGVTFVDNNNGTAILAGTPTTSTEGSYPITITANNGVSPNASQNFTLTVAIPTPTPTPTPTPATLGNISTRLQVGTADRVMIAGFIVQGGAPKRVLIRAAGPSLANFGVPNALPNPQLTLNDGKSTIGRNDDWQTTQIGGVITSDQLAEIQTSGLAPSDSAESAIIATLQPGSYTAIVQGVSDGTGVGIVEVYDLGLTSSSFLANIATRGFVQTGDNAMIGGFIVVSQPTRVMIRAIGPSLSQFGVPDALANPQLELHDANSTIAQNDDWQTTQLGGIITSDQVAAIQNSQLAPTNTAESAIIATLQPGSYTAAVRGVNEGTGNALVEVYALP